MRFVPFLNVSYVKSDFHLMTVAPSFMLRGAGRRAFSISSVVVCANAPAESASMVRPTDIIRFILCPPVHSPGHSIDLIRKQQSWRLVQYIDNGSLVIAVIPLLVRRGGREAAGVVDHTNT